MASLSDVLSQLVILVSGALTAADVTNALVGSEWPPKDDLENVGKSGPPVVAVWHRMTAYKSMNMRYRYSESDAPTGIKSVLSDIVLKPSNSIALTLSYAVGSTQVNLNDGVDLQLTNGDYNQATSTIAGSGATLASMATALASQINTQFASVGISASATGAIITVTNSGSDGFYLQSNCGNLSTINEGIGWAFRSLQIICWSGTLTTKYAIQAAVEGLLTSLQDNYGFTLGSGEVVRLKMTDAKPDDADTDKDVFTDHFLFTVEHVVDQAQQTTEILAAIVDLTATPTP